MPNVASILQNKTTHVVTIAPNATALEAAQRMNQHRIGCLVVTDPRGGRVIGIISERDILTRLVAQQLDPRLTTVSGIMTHNVAVCSPCTPVDDLRTLMQSRRIRHVPVVDDTGLCGMVSIGDLNAFDAAGLAATVEALNGYISHG
ncbi:MAG: histidine kinase [Phycisphaerae bacterium]|nr:MAG: histidine kinase [Phycisphaerae bacterium]